MSQTSDAVQAQLGLPTGSTVLRVEGKNSDTNQYWLVRGGTDSPGVTRWITVPTAQTAAQHATTIKNGIHR